MRIKNKNIARNTVIAGIVMLSAFISLGSFAQNTVKTDSVNKANIIPAKAVTPASATDNNAKISINANNNAVPAATMKRAVQVRQVDKNNIGNGAKNDTINSQKKNKDIQGEEPIKNK